MFNSEKHIEVSDDETSVQFSYHLECKGIEFIRNVCQNLGHQHNNTPGACQATIILISPNITVVIRRHNAHGWQKDAPCYTNHVTFNLYMARNTCMYNFNC